MDTGAGCFALLRRKFGAQTALLMRTCSPNVKVFHPSSPIHTALHFNRDLHSVFKLKLLERVPRLPWSFYGSRHLIFD